MFSPGEEKVIKRINERQVVTRQELLQLFDGENSSKLLEAVIKTLVQKNFITTASPTGSMCYIITKSGMRALEDYE